MTLASESPAKGHKKALSIRLSESAVYLRTEGRGRRSTRDVDPTSTGSLLRGLLVLELTKSTKISSIELELTATTCNVWSEGSGARTAEVNEQHKAFHASMVYFQASKSGSTRRAVSLGPGVYDQDHDLDDEEREPPMRLPATSPSDQSVELEANATILSTSPLGTAGPSSSQTASPRSAQVSLRDRRASVDSRFFLSDLTTYQETQNEIPIPPYSPSDPNGPSFVASPRSATFSDAPWLNLIPSPEERDQWRGQHPSEGLEDFRASLNSNLPTSQTHDLSPSTRSANDRPPLSRVPTFMNNVPEDDTLESAQPLSPQLSTHLRPDPSPPGRSSAHSPAGSLSGSGESSALPGSNSYESPARPGLFQRFSTDTRTPPNTVKATTTSRGRDDGRSRSRFSLSSFSDALKEAVRSTSTSRAARLIIPPSGRSSRRTSPDTRDSPVVAATPSASQDIGREQERSNSWVHRGRTMDRRALVFGGMDSGNGTILASSRPSSMSPNPGHRTSTPQGTSRVNPSKSRQREPRIWGAAFDSDLGSKEKQDVHGWKEFKKGTYNYPISFTIPTTAPPSMQAPYGSVVWKLHATVHRPGTFTQKMTVSREVLVVSCPSEEDTEDTENVIVERPWEDQLHYLIWISGRSFYIGGTVPVMFALMPLGKLKIYRLLVYIEERIDYYTNMHRIARSGPVTRFDLLSVKHEGGRNAPHILPLESDDTDILKHSPLAPLFNTDDDTSELASSLMGPGPWTFHQNLKLPNSCDMMHFTNKNRRANVVVTHVLKVVLRVERGDDMYIDKAGKRKLFDIVVQTPIQILSCRCNPEWVSLPPYSETFNDAAPLVPSCPCQIKRMQERHAHSGIAHILDRIHIPHSPTSHIAGQRHDRLNGAQHDTGSASTSITPDVVRALLQHQEVSTFATSQRYERLVAGQESEFGEPPPAYSPAGASSA